MKPRDERNLIKSGHFMRSQTRMMQGMGYYMAKPYKNLKPQEQMGSWFSDATNINIDVNQAINNATAGIFAALINLPNTIFEAVRSINWDDLDNNLLAMFKEGSRIFFVELNPIHLVWQGLKTCPLTDHLAMELNHLTGGLLTDLDKLGTVTGRAINGDAISEEELIRDAMCAAKIAAIVFSGGSATVIFSQSVDYLKQGTLNESELGRSILNVAAVAGYAYIAEAAVMTAVEHQVIRELAAAGQTEVMKHSPLAETALGRTFINAVFAATSAELIESGSGIKSAANVAKQAAAQQSAEAVCKEAGIPCTPQIVNAFRDADYPPKLENIDMQAISAGSGGTLTFDALSRAVTNVNIKFDLPKIDINLPGGGTVSTETDDKSGSSFIDTNEVDMTQSHIAPVSIAGKKVMVPNPATPEGMAEIIKLWKLIKFLLMKRGKVAKYRTRMQVGTQYYDVYLLEDGSFYWELASSIGFLIAAGLGIMGLFILTGDNK